MPFSLKTSLFFALLCFFAINVSAQRKPKPFYKGRYKSVKISKQKAKVVCPVFQESEYPYQGIGFKLGDPFAITYKFYATKNFALAVDVGRTASGLYSKYYASEFNSYTEGDTLFGTQNIEYLNHKVKFDWQGEAKILYHINGDRWIKGIQGYLGAGWQWRHAQIRYEYILELNFNENEILSFERERFATGPVGVVGLEYSYFELPISAFIELEVFSDVFEDPGWVRPQGGVGLRYIF